MPQGPFFSVSAGSPEPLGLSLTKAGANVAVFSEHATLIELCLFDEQDCEIARIALPERRGNVFHGAVAGVREGQRYGLRAHGPHDLRHGHRFDPSKLLLDPYALALDRPAKLHASLFAPPGGIDSAPFCAKAVAIKPSLSRTRRPQTPWNRTILYELHARGFSMLHPAIPDAERGRFSALASPAAIDHFLNLGVTAIEVLPMAAKLDERHLPPLGLTNYWRYNPIAFMAPDPALAPGGWREIARTVDRLHEAGLEVILDVVFNHSGEGDAQGPTVGLRGLDNARYYRLKPDHPAAYVDDAGCGNTLRCDDAQVVRLIMDSLRAWALYGGVDGFRFDLATTLGRRDGGFDPHAPFFAALLQDPVLKDLKLIAEAWDIGPGGYQVGALDAPFADWNDRYRDTIRRFWRGDKDVFAETATRLSGSSDLFVARRQPSSSINFVVAHDGFTLADLVSFDRKSNLANGEGNRDGTDNNNSWNHGVEGPSRDPSVLARRAQDQRNLLATLLLSLGTPMLLAGSEFGQSQQGNNNAYAQDNPISWLDWDKADPSLMEVTARLGALRKRHPVFSRNRFLTGKPETGGRFPDVVWLRADGQAMTDTDWNSGARASILALFSARQDNQDHRLLLCLHRGEKPITLVLPEPQKGKSWKSEIDTSEEPTFCAQVAGRSVKLWVET